MTTLADKTIILGADNRPPMLEKDIYDSWKSIMELYMMSRQHGRMILEFVENGPLIWPSIEENEVTRPKKYSELSATEAIQADCDVKETNIILQGLPPEVYALVSNHKVTKELWERIQLLMQGTSLTKQEREYSGLTIPVFQKGDDPIDVINHMMLFLTAVVTSQVKVQPIQGRHASLAIAVQNSNFPAQQDALILSVIEQLKTQVVNCTKINTNNKSFNDTLTAELERYKDQVRILKEGHNVDLKSKDVISDSCAQSVEIDNLKQTLSEHLKEKESLMQTVTLLKNDFQKEESRNIDREIVLEKQIKELNNIVYKRNQSAKTVHMLTKPRFFYDHTTKQALGFQNPFYLKKAQQL
nr:hypothetical protein [Tanacetum cinerariifolium]